jgi:hypothetical protein
VGDIYPIKTRQTRLKSGHGDSQLPAEGLVEQGFFQRLQRGELLLVDGGEAGGFFGESVELSDDLTLFLERFWESNRDSPQVVIVKPRYRSALGGVPFTGTVEVIQVIVERLLFIVINPDDI